MAWGEVKAGLVRAVSIGFRAVEYAFIEGTGGIRFIASEVLELSLVSVPANAGATITSIKSIDRPMLAATGKEPGAADRPVPPGVTGKSKKPVNLLPKEGTKMNIKEQIAALEKKRGDHQARLLEIQSKASDAGRTKDQSEQDEFDTLRTELTSIDAELVDLKALDDMNVRTAKPAAGADAAAASAARQPGLVVVKSPSVIKGAGFIRMVGALGPDQGQPLRGRPDRGTALEGYDPGGRRHPAHAAGHHREDRRQRRHHDRHDLGGAFGPVPEPGQRVHRISPPAVHRRPHLRASGACRSW
jgi:hypothetical protein